MNRPQRYVFAILALSVGKPTEIARQHGCSGFKGVNCADRAVMVGMNKVRAGDVAQRGACGRCEAVHISNLQQQRIETGFGPGNGRG